MQAEVIYQWLPWPKNFCMNPKLKVFSCGSGIHKTKHMQNTRSNEEQLLQTTCYQVKVKNQNEIKLDSMQNMTS